MKSKLMRDGFVVSSILTPPSDHELIDLALTFGPELLHWDFGPIMRMAYDANAKNYLFSKEAVPFHWDGAFHREPRFLLFYCDQSLGSGGETLFCDTFKIINDFPLDELLNVQMNFKTEKLAHYGGEINVSLLQRHPQNGEFILRFAEAVTSLRNPVSLKMKNHRPDLYQRLVESAYKHAYTHRWNTGDLIIVDNFRFIHGRKPLATNLSRSFRRLQIM